MSFFPAEWQRIFCRYTWPKCSFASGAINSLKFGFIVRNICAMYQWIYYDFALTLWRIASAAACTSFTAGEGPDPKRTCSLTATFIGYYRVNEVFFICIAAGIRLRVWCGTVVRRLRTPLRCQTP